MVAVILILAVAGAIVWLSRRTHGSSDSGARDEVELENAEREVRDLPPFASPGDASEQLPDWGPGVPKR